MTDKYGKWLLDLVDAASEDEMWRLFASMEPPDDPVTKAQLREQLIKVFKKRKISAPARTADAWLYPRRTNTRATNPSDEREQVHRCPALGRKRDILAELAQDLQAVGHAGEERACKLIYLAVTSRLFEQIVSAVVKGPSAAGKSATVARVLRFFPAEAFYELTSGSEHALAYDEEPMQHRMFVVYEWAGMAGDKASYLMRSLLSEGRIRHKTVEKGEDGQLRARLIEREGPTGLLVTTTSVRLHVENETRLLSVPVDDTREQTRRVIAAIAKGNGRVVNYTPWHDLQFWLHDDGERRVVIPFREVLGDRVNPLAVRLRRDVKTVLALTEAHALLHRATREKDKDGRIVATLDDYEAVHKLVNDLIADAVGATVSQTTRETVDAVAEITDGRPNKHATLAQLDKRLKLDRSSTTRRVNKAIDQGYLIDDSAGQRGKAKQLRLGDPLPEGQAVLPDRKTLEDNLCTYARETEGI